MDETFDSSLDSMDYSIPDSSLDLQLDESDFDVSGGFDVGNYETAPEIGEMTIEPEISGELPHADPVDSTEWDQLTELPSFEEHMETDIDSIMDEAPDPESFDSMDDELSLDMDSIDGISDEQMIGDIGIEDMEEGQISDIEENVDFIPGDAIDGEPMDVSIPEMTEEEAESFDQFTVDEGTPDTGMVDMEEGIDYTIPHTTDVGEVGEIAPLENVNDWIGEINPNFDVFDTESPYSNNCGSCAYSVYQRLEGNPEACASAENIGYNSEMEALTGMEQVSMSPEEIEQRLLDQGAGSHAIIGIDRAEGMGHWFNAANIDGKVVAIDGQDGTITDWPPDYGDVVNWEMSVKKENING